MRAAALQSISNKFCKLWTQIPFTFAVTFEDALIDMGTGTCDGKLNDQPRGRSYLTYAFTMSPPCELELGMDRNRKTSHGRDNSVCQKRWSNLVSRSTNILLFVRSQQEDITPRRHVTFLGHPSLKPVSRMRNNLKESMGVKGSALRPVILINLLSHPSEKINSSLWRQGLIARRLRPSRGPHPCDPRGVERQTSSIPSCLERRCLLSARPPQQLRASVQLRAHASQSPLVLVLPRPVLPTAARSSSCASLPVRCHQ